VRSRQRFVDVECGIAWFWRFIGRHEFSLFMFSTSPYFPWVLVVSMLLLLAVVIFFSLRERERKERKGKPVCNAE